jgi:hypothetical protein
MPDASEYFDLCRAAKLFPADPSMACIWRWCRKGCKARNGERVHLKHVRVGGKLYTTKEWADQFMADMAKHDQQHFRPEPPAEAAPVESPSPPLELLPAFTRTRTAQQREAAIRHAERVVASWGKGKKPRANSGSDPAPLAMKAPPPTPLHERTAEYYRNRTPQQRAEDIARAEQVVASWDKKKKPKPAG